MKYKIGKKTNFNNEISILLTIRFVTWFSLPSLYKDCDLFIFNGFQLIKKLKFHIFTGLLILPTNVVTSWIRKDL